MEETCEEMVVEYILLEKYILAFQINQRIIRIFYLISKLTILYSSGNYFNGYANHELCTK